MQYTVEQLYQHIIRNVNGVYDIFKDFFGENYTDLQLRNGEEYVKHLLEVYLRDSGVPVVDNTEEKIYEISETRISTIDNLYSDYRAYIYVWWPSVTITNENNKSITITDLYAKVAISFEGTIPYEYGGFTLNRSSYTSEQFASDYMHSHIPGIPKTDFTKFLSPCLGRGPIRNTIHTLNTENDDTTWMLFCQELSMYVTVESLSGIPYRYLEKIGKTNTCYTYNEGYNGAGHYETFIRKFSKNDYIRFIKYYLQNGHLSLSFKNGVFVSGMPFHSYVIDVSNAFIDFYNQYLKTTAADCVELFDRGLLNRVIVVNGKFYNIDSNHRIDNISTYLGQHVLTFKGKPITLSITNNNSEEITPSIILQNSLCLDVLFKILKVINFRYKNEHNKNKGNEENTSTYKRILYL